MRTRLLTTTGLLSCTLIISACTLLDRNMNPSPSEQRCKELQSDFLFDPSNVDTDLQEINPAKRAQALKEYDRFYCNEVLHKDQDQSES